MNSAYVTIGTSTNRCVTSVNVVSSMEEESRQQQQTVQIIYIYLLI